MTDREGQDHWGLLASNLGIEPRDEATNPTSGQQPTPAKGIATEASVGLASQGEETAGIEAKAYVKKPAQASRTAGDWARLASGLGLALPPEEPASVAVPETPEVVAEPAVEPVAEKEPELPLAEPEVVAEEWTESVIELMEESLESPEPSDRPPVTPQPADERRPERRRRRRRRRSRRPAEGDSAGARTEEPREPTASEPGEAVSELETASHEQDIEEDELPGESSATTTAPAEGEPQPGRSRRRRRRRGGDRRRDRDRPDREGSAPAKSGRVVPSEDVTSEVSIAQSPIIDEHDTEELSPAETDDELGDEFDEDRTDKEGHRAIPSWDEAVANIVGRNMEARARKPDSGSSRSRGGRGRGRGRD